MSAESEKKQHLEQTDIRIPRYNPGNPPKNYGEKKAISIFCCLHFSFGFGCPELLRARITKKGDIYVIPFSEYGIGDFHLSHHESGEFHWGHDRTHDKPAYGEGDFAAAFGLWLKVRSPLCFCLRKGKNLNNEDIAILVQRLAQNFPFAFDIETASRDLERSNFYRLVLAALKQKSCEQKSNG